MKKLLFLAAAIVTGIGAMAQTDLTGAVKVNSETHNFGKIKQGVPVTTYFTISNTSNRPLVIESAQAGCGCTTPEYSKEPIAAGGSTKLKVGYNAANAAPFTKEVTVRFAGYQQPLIVKITGEVVGEGTTPTSTQAPAQAPSSIQPLGEVKASTKTKATVKKAS